MRARHRLILPSMLLALLCLTPVQARAAWFDSAWLFRRPLEVAWDPDKTARPQLAVAEFYTAGHLEPAGADVRVATEEGKPVASHVLMVGPGDRVRVVFALVKPVRKYFVYFGNPEPAPPRPGLEDVKYDSGLLMEMRDLAPSSVGSDQHIEETWNKSTSMIGRTMIAQPFLGINPFGPQERTISKLTGVLTAPIEGDYILSMWADDYGALRIDDKPVLFAPPGPADTRIRVTLRLKRGPHPFVLFHVNTGGEGRFTVVWQRPDKTAFELIAPESFGLVNPTKVGPLEEIRKNLTADFAVEYGGECFFAGAYAHHYHFTGHSLKTARAQYTWDFGDGQTAAGSEVGHVYLADGVYPVKLTVKVGANADSQTTKLFVARDWAHIQNPPGEAPPAQSKIVATYDPSKLSAESLVRAVLLHQRAENLDPMLAAAARLATLPKHPNPDQAMEALTDATRTAITGGRIDAVVALWKTVPPSSDLQPRAVRQTAQLLLWRTGDFTAAVRALEPHAASGDDKLKRIYGDALVLAQKGEEGRKILESLPVADQTERRVALSGALARTIEYYITTKEWEAGEEAWEDWQARFPADFLEGYSVVLKVKLLEMKGASAAAAQVAVAFATALPGSSYAPQLLDRAGKLLAASEPGKAAALRQLLKERYPEDPLSQ